MAKNEAYIKSSETRFAASKLIELEVMLKTIAASALYQTPTNVYEKNELRDSDDNAAINVRKLLLRYWQHERSVIQIERDIKHQWHRKHLI